MARRPKKSVLFINGELSQSIAEEFSEVQEVLHDSSLTMLAPLFDVCFDRILRNMKSAKGLSILYFASHGEFSGIKIRHRTPQQKNLDREMTAEMIAAAVRESQKDPLDLMLFNCCDSAEIAEELTVLGGARAAIGWEQKVSHSACKSFARIFFGKLKLSYSKSDHVAIGNAFDEVKREFGDSLRFHSINDHQRPFDVVVELSKKTIEQQNRIKVELCRFLGKKRNSSVEELSDGLFIQENRKDIAVSVFSRFVKYLAQKSVQLKHDEFTCLRILADLCYIKSLPADDLAWIAHSLRKTVEQIKARNPPKKVRLHSRMSIDSICSVLQKAHSELKDQEGAMREFEWYYNRNVQEGDVSFLFEDKLIVLDCANVDPEAVDSKKQIALMGALRRLPVSLVKDYEDFSRLIEVLVSAGNTIAVLLREEQYDSWERLCGRHSIVPVVCPKDETKCYIRIQQSMAVIKKFLDRIWSDPQIVV